MKMTNYVPPRPYAGINKPSDRMKWAQTILGAFLILTFILVGLFTWGWIERREDQRVNSRIVEDDRGPMLKKLYQEALK